VYIGQAVGYVRMDADYKDLLFERLSKDFVIMKSRHPKAFIIGKQCIKVYDLVKALEGKRPANDLFFDQNCCN
jgi:hypothetical protein